jgi:hypothetical protein
MKCCAPLLWLALALTTGQASALSATGMQRIGSAGGWTIAHDASGTGTCLAFATYKSGTRVFVGLTGPNKSWFFSFTNPDWRSIRSGQSYDIKYLFNNKRSWAGPSIGTENGLIAGNLKDKFISDFAKSRVLELKNGKRRIDRISLRGTRKATRAVKRCYANRVRQSDPFSTATNQPTDPFSSGTRQPTDPFADKARSGNQGSPAPAPADRTPAPPAQPNFSGDIGHFDQSVDFSRFIFGNQQKIVFIDARFQPGEHDNIATNRAFQFDSLLLWEACEPLSAGEAPSSAKCSGNEFNIDRSAGNKDADAHLIRGSARIKGYFVVSGCSGPHQGLMGCTLRPLNANEVL